MEPTENDSKTNKSRFWLSFMLDDMPTGEIFKPGKLHITLIPWFVVDEDDVYVVQAFQKEFRDQLAFEVEVGETAMFGPKSDVPVTLIAPSQPLEVLHHRTMSWFNQIGARWAVKHPHVEREYRAHIRCRPGVRLETGQKIKINSLSLIKAARREDGQRLVLAKAAFNG